MSSDKYQFFDDYDFLWKDCTSYGQGNKEKIPTSYRTNLRYKRDVSITITCGHLYYKGEWVYICRALGVESPRLLGKDIQTREEAASEAIKNCREIVTDFSRALKIIKP